MIDPRLHRHFAERMADQWRSEFAAGALGIFGPALGLISAEMAKGVLLGTLVIVTLPLAADLWRAARGRRKGGAA